jgi:hypothetical protein
MILRDGGGGREPAAAASAGHARTARARRTHQPQLTPTAA